MNLPQEMKEEVGYLIKGVSDHMHQELTPMQVYRIFEEHYVNRISYSISRNVISSRKRESGLPLPWSRMASGWC